MSAQIFLFSGRGIFKTSSADVQRLTDHARFRSHFGVSCETTARLWSAIKPSLPSEARPKHLLWGLLKLKCYTTDEVCASLCRTTRATYQKWMWVIVRALSKLKKVRKIIFFSVFEETVFAQLTLR